MANPQPPTQVFRHYFYEESRDIVYYSENFPENLGSMIHLGDSDNPKPKSAVAVFMKGQRGYKIVNLDA